jgi:hypothetical protein
MISIEQLRKIEPAFEKYSDKELLKIRALLYSAGQLALENYVADKGGSKYPVGDKHKIDNMV